MKFHEAEAVIEARASTVWDILTDTSNVTVWDSGVTALEGDLRDGGTIRLRMKGQGRRGVRMRVRQVPGQAMRWRASAPFGLLIRAYTVVLSPEAGQTRLRIRHELSGPLAPFTARKLLAPRAGLQVFVEAVKERAELLDRHL